MHRLMRAVGILWSSLKEKKLLLTPQKNFSRVKEYLIVNKGLWESLKPFQQAQHVMKITRKSSLNVVLKDIFHHVRPPYLLTERMCKFKLDSIQGRNLHFPHCWRHRTKQVLSCKSYHTFWLLNHSFDAIFHWLYFLNILWILDIFSAFFYILYNLIVAFSLIFYYFAKFFFFDYYNHFFFNYLVPPPPCSSFFFRFHWFYTF